MSAQAKPVPPTGGRNSKISASVGRLSRTRAYQKKGAYKFQGKRTAQPAAQADEPTTVTKKVGGAKNSESRTVPVSKAQRYYPSEDVRAPKRSRKSPKPAHLKSGIQPGQVLILLAGRFAGKRVVFLKQLASGLLLVTGPFKVNGVPIRRVNQAYTIVTSTRVNLEGVSIDAKFDDAYFKKAASSSKTKPEASFFADPANKAPHPSNKVADQKEVDKAVIAAAKKGGPVLLKYLAATFSLSNGDRPHTMRF